MKCLVTNTVNHGPFKSSVMDNSRRSFLKTSVALATGAIITPNAYAKESYNPLTSDSLNTKTKSQTVCVFTKCLQYLNYDRLAQTLAKAGYNGADLSVREEGHVQPENVKTDLPRLVKILNNAGISTPMMVTTIIDAKDKNTESILAVAADMGIEYYRMGYLNYDKTKTIPQNIDVWKKSFEQLEKLNRKYGIHGSYQNHSGTRVGGPVWDLYPLVKDLDPQYMGVQYDIRHAICEGGRSWSLGMELLAPWIKSCPIKDFIWQKTENHWKIQDVPLGRGMVDFDSFLRKYKELKITGPFSIHLEYDLGGADKGSRTPTMDHEKIAHYLKQDIDWFRNKLKEYNLD